MSPAYLAIDPGANGAIVHATHDGRVVCHKMGDDVEIRDLIESIATAARMEGWTLVAVMEQVGGYVGGAGAPGSAMFRFGDGYGHLRGLLSAYHIRTELIRPQKWQAGIPGLKAADGKSAEKSIRKRALKEHAGRLFPDQKVTLANCDALLILDYARRNNL